MSGPRTDYWTPEQDAKLRELDAKGWSCSQIGKAMGKTRNAVIGRRSRLGMATSVKVLKAQRSSAGIQSGIARRLSVKRNYSGEATLAAKLKALKSAATPPSPPKEPYRAGDVGRVHLLALTSHDCRWPVGEGPETLFCGQPTEGSYCADHARIAYLPRPAKSKASDLMRLYRRHYA